MKKEVSVVVWIQRVGAFDFILDRPMYPNQTPAFIAQDYGDHIGDYHVAKFAKALKKERRHADAQLFERLVRLRLFGKAILLAMEGVRKP